MEKIKCCKSCRWSEWKRNKAGARMFCSPKNPGKCVASGPFFGASISGYSGLNCNFWEEKEGRSNGK